MTDDEQAIYQLQKRLSEALAGQATLQRTIQGLEVDKARLERERDELRSAVAALLAPSPGLTVVTGEPLPPYGVNYPKRKV